MFYHTRYHSPPSHPSSTHVTCVKTHSDVQKFYQPDVYKRTPRNFTHISLPALLCVPNRDISERPVLSVLIFFMGPNQYWAQAVSVAAVVNDPGRTISFVKVRVAGICHNIGDTAGQREELTTFGVGQEGAKCEGVKLVKQEEHF